MSLTLEERLNKIISRITSKEFLESKGLGNEIGFWIFDYPVDRELVVRDFLNGTVLPALKKHVLLIHDQLDFGFLIIQLIVN